MRDSPIIIPGSPGSHPGLPHAALPILLLFAGLLASCAQPEKAPPAAVSTLPDDAPRLVLFLVVDQARADYLERYRELFTGGLARLLDESVNFTAAHHDHAETTTSPGHATLATGAHPSRHGIIDNYWIDRESGDEIYAVRDDQRRTSPERLLVPTFGAWLKEAAPGAKVFAASGKDRSAVLMAGQAGEAAFWLDRQTGDFTTADYYSADPEAEYPWLESFHAAHHARQYFGTLWEPLPEVAAAVSDEASPFDLASLDGGVFDFQFPHALGSPAPAPGWSFYYGVYRSPMVDEYLGKFALALLDGEGLGADATTDFLGLSFSAVDTVGHDYGPDSPEVLDTLLRLDRVLGELLAAVDQKIGLENVVVSLSSDHGVAPVPEARAAHGDAARRLGDLEIPCVQRAGLSLNERFGEAEWIVDNYYFDPEVASERGVEVATLAAALAAELEECPGIVHAWTRAEITTAGDDPMGRLYAHSFHPERSADLVVELEPFALTSSAMTTHGTPHEYDTHVPWLLRLPAGEPRTVDERVHTVDVAPTIAALVGLEIPVEIDGVDRGTLLSP